MSTNYELYDGNGNLVHNGSIYDGMNLQQVLPLRIQEIENYASNILNSGFTWNSNTFGSGADDRLKIMSLKARLDSGGTLPSPYSYMDLNGTAISMTQADFIDFANTLVTFLQNVDNQENIHITNISALLTVDSIIAYDITTGWGTNNLTFGTSVVPPVPNQLLSGTSSNTTSGTAFTTISGMSIVPTAGTFLVDFNCWAAITANNEGRIAIFYNGTEQTFTERSILANTNGIVVTANIASSIASACTIITDGVSTLDVRFRAVSGTLTVTNRSLLLIQAG